MDEYYYLKFFIALIFVIALMGGLSLLLRRFLPGSAPFVKAANRRLKITEMIVIDHKRKAILLQRDDKEHLIIIGSNSEIVVETNIKAKGSNDG